MKDTRVAGPCQYPTRRELHHFIESNPGPVASHIMRYRQQILDSDPGAIGPGYGCLWVESVRLWVELSANGSDL